jgi:uncharacterized protein YxeA
MKRNILTFIIFCLSIIAVQAQVGNKNELGKENSAIKQRGKKEKKDKLAQDRNNIHYEKQRKKQDAMENDQDMTAVPKKTLNHERKRKRQDKQSGVVRP